MAEKDNPSVDGDNQKWCPMQRLKSVIHCWLEIQTTPALAHPAHTSDFQPILEVIMPRVGETIQSVICEMTYGTEYKRSTLLDAEHLNSPYWNLNTCIYQPEHRCNIHRITYVASTPMSETIKQQLFLILFMQLLAFTKVSAVINQKH